MMIMDPPAALVCRGLSNRSAQPGLTVVPKARDECRDKREPRDGPLLIETAKRPPTPGRVREIGSSSSEGPASVGCKPARSVRCNRDFIDGRGPCQG